VSNHQSDRRFVALVDHLQETVQEYVRTFPDTTRPQVAAALQYLRNGVEWEAELDQHLARAVHDYQEQHPGATPEQVIAALRVFTDALAAKAATAPK
jgi:uncharacterized protein (DUF433 family)